MVAIQNLTDTSFVIFGASSPILLLLMQKPARKIYK